MTVSSQNCYFLGLALESIRIQFWGCIEVVVVTDHASLKDEIDEYLQSNRLRGTVALCEPRLTRSQKFLQCVKMCKGRWIVVLDCDDLLPTGALEILDRCLVEFPQAEFFTSYQQHIDTKNRPLKLVCPTVRDNSYDSIRNRFIQKHLWGFRRDCLAMFSVALDSPYICEDYHFFSTMAMLKRYPLLVPYALCCYRRHSQQMTQVKREKILAMVASIRQKMDRFGSTAHSEFFLNEEFHLQSGEKQTKRLKDLRLEQE